MTYTVKVEIPTAGDQAVYIHGLGTFPNNATSEVDDEQVERYKIIAGTQDIEHHEGGSYTATFVPAPDPIELNIPGVEIKKKGPNSASESDKMPVDKQEEGGK